MPSTESVTNELDCVVSLEYNPAATKMFSYQLAKQLQDNLYLHGMNLLFWQKLMRNDIKTSLLTSLVFASLPYFSDEGQGYWTKSSGNCSKTQFMMRIYALPFLVGVKVSGISFNTAVR